MRDARKLFRLFKSLVEYHKIQELLKSKGPQHKQVINVLARLGFFFYWIFDNIQILSKVKFIEGVDTAQMAKRAATFWLIGLLFSIAGVIVAMYETAQEEAIIVAQKKSAGGDEKQLATFKERLHAVNKKKFDNILNLLKNLGDMVTASQAIGLPRKLLGFDFNDG